MSTYDDEYDALSSSMFNQEIKASEELIAHLNSFLVKVQEVRLKVWSNRGNDAISSLEGPVAELVSWADSLKEHPLAGSKGS